MKCCWQCDKHKETKERNPREASKKKAAWNKIQYDEGV